MRAFGVTPLVGALWLLIASGGAAADFDGSKSLLCVPTDITSCHGAGDCGRMSAEEAAVPQFVRIDFKNKIATGRLANGVENKTSFKGFQRLQDGGLVIQGLGRDGVRAYSMRIDGNDGKMSVAIAGEGGGILILGACTPP